MMQRELDTVIRSSARGLSEAEIAVLALSFFPGLSFNEVTRTLNVVNLLALFKARSQLLLRIAEEKETISSNPSLPASEGRLLSDFLHR